MHENNNPLITNPSDPRLTLLHLLGTEIGRARSAEYIIEGIRHVARAFEQRIPLKLLFVDPSLLSNPFGRKLARRIRQSGTQSIRVSPAIYQDLTCAAQPQGIGAVARQQWTPVGELKTGRDWLWLALESIDQPGNLGTMLRTAEAAGVSGIFLLGQGADPFDPACVRATMGALFSQKLIRCTTFEFGEWVRSNRITVVGSSPTALMSYREMQSRWPMVLLIGSERQGLSQQLIDLAKVMVRIPMCGRSDSINAAVATGILLFQFSGLRKGALLRS